MSEVPPSISDAEGVCRHGITLEMVTHDNLPLSWRLIHSWRLMHAPRLFRDFSPPWDLTIFADFRRFLKFSKSFF